MLLCDSLRYENAKRQDRGQVELNLLNSSATGDGPDIAIALYGPIYREALVAVGHKFAERELDRIDAVSGEYFFTMLIRRTINAVKQKNHQEAGGSPEAKAHPSPSAHAPAV